MYFIFLIFPVPFGRTVLILNLKQFVFVINTESVLFLLFVIRITLEIGKMSVVAVICTTATDLSIGYMFSPHL